MAIDQLTPPYTFKAGPYSSHTLLLKSLPADGLGRRVLDVGCASGYLGEEFARRGYDVTGIDRPGPAPTGFPRIDWDLDQGLPPLTGRFDYVLCADVLEHVREPEKLLAAIARVMEPGGRLVLSLPNSGHLYFRLNILLGRFPRDDRGLFDRTHLHFYMWSGWVDLLHAAGFTLETVSPTGVPVSLALPQWESSAFVRAMEWLSFTLARVWKKLFAYQFVVTARRT